MFPVPPLHAPVEKPLYPTVLAFNMGLANWAEGFVALAETPRTYLEVGQVVFDVNI